MSVVSLVNLTKSYGGRPPALRDVTLEVPPGVTGLLGPNGAGKSTLLQCVLGLLPDYDGEVTVLGLDARRDRQAIRRRVGFMPESDAYLPGMTGIRAVRYLGQLSGMPRSEALRRAHEMLYHVGLGEAIYRQVKEYSTGMRQRFKLATALVHDPDLVFLDEPLSGLDPAGRTELLELIRDLATVHGKHILWSSHILPDVEKVADHVIVLDKGKFHGRFRMEELLSDASRVRVELEGDADAFRAGLADVGITLGPDAVHEAEARAAGRSAWIAELPPGRTGADLLRTAHGAGVRIRRMLPVAENLQDVFLRLLGTPGSR
ncbi:MAG: ABC transporter ATP-binding protein [Planctomycetota bacterium]|nr:ABC transporter ATP-binding protein [Planctomycetota bacterium]